MNENDNYDIMSEHNNKVYLTQCLTFAHINNNPFQRQMKEYFSDVQCEYASAPVKMYDRCVMKATSDYGNNQFPSASHILDFLRFSVTFDTMNDLLNGLNAFIEDINQNQIQCLKPNGILRIKNGFKDIKSKWKSVNQAEYCDIKLNIIYRSNTSDNENEKKEEECMIVEAQFLLLFLLKAKKMGHKLYSILSDNLIILTILQIKFIILMAIMININ